MNLIQLVCLIVSISSTTTSTEICTTGERYEGLCYFIISPVKMTWYEAREHCEESGATLAIPSSQSVQDFIWGIAEREFDQGLQRASLWIGCNDIEEEGNWQHCPLTTNAFENWADGQPDDDYGADCGVLWEPQSGVWDDQDCNYSANYPVCEIPVVSTITPLIDAAVRLTPQCLLRRAMEEYQNGASSCQSHSRCHSFNLLEQDCSPSNKTT